jgi:formyl-CoA transferase
LFAATGILAALLHRNQAGVGQYVDTSLVEAGVALSVWEATEFFAGVGVPGPLGSAHRMVAPYQAIQCADGYITIGASNNKLFERLCEALGHPEWVRVPEYADNPSRVRNRIALARVIESVTAAQPRAHWLAALGQRDIPCGPIHDYAEVFADPHIVAREMVVDVDHPSLGSMRALGSPIKMSATPPDVRRRAPRLGEHTDAVFREIGLAR